MKKVVGALKIPVAALKNMSEESAFNVIANTFNSYDTSVGNRSNFQCSFDFLDKMVELYERMLEMEREKINSRQHFNVSKSSTRKAEQKIGTRWREGNYSIFSLLYGVFFITSRCIVKLICYNIE